jgi:pyruvate formate lyase activating enzyme
MQPRFLLDLLYDLTALNTVLETSGHGDSKTFSEAIELVDTVLFDIKLLDSAKHMHYTNADNSLILKNLLILKASGKPFTVRMPIIPGVNDHIEYFRGVADLLNDVKDRINVEILPFNPLAGAKYASVALDYQPDYDENVPASYFIEVFEASGIPICIL